MFVKKTDRFKHAHSIKQLAKNNRTRQTDAEKILWGIVRRHALNGCKFRRQHKIGNFIVDFVCIEKKLVIELDGRYHEIPKQFAYDEQRSTVLRERGFKVVRFWNSEVLFERDTVINTILEMLTDDEEHR